MALLSRPQARAVRARKHRARLTLEALESRLAPSAVVGVNAATNVHAIDPNIYGAAFATTAQLADLNLTVNRDGGNSSDTYNWQTDATNHASDWYYESIPSGSGNGQSMDAFVSQTDAGGAQADVTIPILPYVASLPANRSDLGSYPVSVYGAQQYTDPYNSNFGNGVTTGGQNITDTNPLSNYVANSPAFEQTWIQHLLSTFGTPGRGGVPFFTLGNEPGLWNSTHRDIHPSGETNTELLNDFISYGSMIKALDPGAQILGPEEWGWTNYFVDGADAAAGNYGATYNGLNVEQWLLQQLDQYQAQHGTRLLDYFTLHYYPQESVNGDYNGGVDSDNVDQATELLRNQVTRSLWDPSYVDPSWIASTGINGGKVDLIPMMRSWVNTYYPGTMTGITEYNFGAEDNMNGATTQADLYGIFGQQGLNLATRWTMPATGTPTYLAMKLWRNYDGNNSGFGDTSVGASVGNPDQTDAFAAVRSSDGALTVAVINKNLYDPNNPSATTSVTVNLSGFANSGVAQAWQLAAINPSDQTTAAITHLANVSVSGNSFTLNVPMESVTMFVIEPAAPAAPTGLSATAVALTQVNLAWTNKATNQTGFQVDRATNSTFTQGLVTVSVAASATSYSATGLAAGTTYWFRVRATNGGGPSANSNVVSLNPGAPAKVAFTTPPTTTTAGAAMAPAVTVQIEDQFGNLVSTDSTDTVTVGIASGPGGFTGASTTTATASGGIATFSNLVLDTAGSYLLSETASNSLSGPASSSFTVTAGAVSHLAVSALSSSITAGNGLGLVVTALDSFNNPTTDAGAVTFTSNDPQVHAPVSSPVSFSGGPAYAVGTLETATATGWTITAIDSTSHSGPSNLVQVTPTAANHFGVAAASVIGSASIITGGASESGSTVTINTTTAHGFSVGQSVNIAGVTQSGYNGTVLITSVPTTTSFTYTALANHLGLTPSGGGTVTRVATTGSTFNVVVTALDPYGNTATGYTGTVKLTSSDAAASFPVNGYAFTISGAAPDNGVHTFSAALNTPGTSQTLTATDTSNASIVGSSAHSMFTVGLYLTALAPTPSGFTATFNKLLNPSQLAYYRFAGQTVRPDISMTLGSSTTTVNGSVVMSATATQSTLTFVATQGALTAGPYTITLASGSNGILDTAGGQLAGDANGLVPGTSYSTSITPASASASTLIIPSFARGPGSNVQVPNNTGTGIPVTLKNAPANTKTVTFTLDFNPALLDVTGPTTGTLLLLNPSTANSSGVANFSFSSATAVSTTSTLLGSIAANVPSSASSQYKAKALLDLPESLITIGGVSSASYQNADGVEINAYLGDVNADYKIDGSDAALVAGVLNAPNNAANMPAGFAAYPLADPALLGSPSNNPATATPKITSADVTLLNRYAANLNPPQIPAPPTGLTYTAAGPDPALSLPASLPVSADGTVVVPVNLDDARPTGSTGMTEATLALTYDPRVLTVSASDVHLGTVPASGRGWTLATAVNAVTGQLAITLESATPIARVLGGSLVTIDFHVRPGAVPEAGSVALVATVDPSGQRLLQTNVFDSQGAFTLSPAPTNGARDAVAVTTLVGTDSPGEAVVVTAANDDTPPLTLPTVAEAKPPATSRAADDKTTVATPMDGAAAEQEVLRPGRVGVHDAGMLDLAAAEIVLYPTGVATVAVQGSGLLLPFDTVALVSVLTRGGLAAQPPADLFVPAVGRGAGVAADPALSDSPNDDAVEAILASELTIARSTPANGERLFGDSSKGRRRAPVRTSAALPPAERDVIERYFAQIADDADQTLDDATDE